MNSKPQTPNSQLPTRARLAGWLTLALLCVAFAANAAAQPGFPQITQQPANLVVAVNSNATFTVLATGSEPLAYQWYFDLLTAIPDGTNATLLLTNVQPTHAGSYQVVITNPAGVVNSIEAWLAVQYPPAILTPPASLTVTQGASATFTASHSGDGPFTYQWFHNTTNPIPHATNLSLTLPTAQAADAGTYTLRVTTPVGSTLSPAATLEIRLPPLILSQPANLAVLAGAPATFTVLAHGDPPLAYQWFFNGTNALAADGTPATDPTLQIPSAQLSDTGLYTVVVTNPVGTTTSASATLLVMTLPQITQPPASLTVTQGQTATLTVLATATPPPTFQWYFNGTNLSSFEFGVSGFEFNPKPETPNSQLPTLTFTNVQPAHAGQYTVTISNQAGLILSTPATLLVKVPPAILQQPAHRIVAPGAPATFTVLALGDAPLTYQWYFNPDGTSATHPLSDATNSSLQLDNVQPSSAGHYTVRIANDLGTLTSLPARLTLQQPPTLLQQPASLTLTQGHPATLTAQIGGDGPFTYQWYFNGTNLSDFDFGVSSSEINPRPETPNSKLPTLTFTNIQPAHAGTYALRVTNLVSFAISQDAQLTVRLIPTLTQQPASQARTTGTDATFTVTVSGEEPFTYQWFFNETNALPDATNRTLVRTNLQPADAGLYSVTISNAVGSVTSALALLTIQVPPSILAQPISLVTTQGSSATFTVTAAGDGPLSYQWFFNGVSLSGFEFGVSSLEFNPKPETPNSKLPTLTFTNVQPAHAGAYSVRVTNAVGSVFSDAATLTVNLWPALTQQPASLVATQGQTATLSVTATSETPLTYRWRWNGTNLPGGTSPNLSFENLQPAQAGAYDVVVQNDFGSVTSTLATLTVFGLDFGDAPEPPYQTYLASDGARHVLVPGIHLGVTADAEPDGQPTISASADDMSAGVNENGVRFLTSLRSGQPATLEIIASTPGRLNAWLDLNQSGAWDQAAEQVITNRALIAGTNTFALTIPRAAAPGQTFARFRFSTASVLTPTGLAPDGEVEDYALTILPSAEVMVSQAVSSPGVTAGNNATITLNVTNRGPSDASGVTVLSQLSTRTTFISANTTQGTCGHTNGALTCHLGTLPGGAQASITLVARIGAGTNNLLASVTAAEFDPDASNNSAPAAIVGTLNLPADSNTDPIILPVDDPGPGDLYPSQITVAGATSSVFKVTVTVRDINHSFPDDIDILLVGPRGQKVMLMSDNGLDNPLVDVTVTLDDEAAQSLPDGDPQIVTGTYKPTNFGTTSDDFEPPAPTAPYVTNLAVFRGTDPNGIWSLYVRDDQPLNSDPQGGDPGFVALGWTLSITTGDPMADLFITQSAQPNPVIVGNHLFHTLNVTNRGPAVSSAIVNNPLPPSVNFVAATTTRGSCTANAGIVTCNLGDLASGAGGRITLEVAPTLGGLITNVVSVSGNQLELVPADNSATLITTVLPVADLQLTASTLPSSVLLGQPILHSLVVTNLGPNLATGIALTNILPPGVSFLSVTTSQGSCVNQGASVACNLGNLATAAQALIQISAVPTVTGISSNFAVVAAAPLDFNSTNNAAASLVTVNPAADLALTAVTPTGPLPAGRDFVTVLTVSNRGPSTANVQLIDPLPSIVTFASANATRGSCSFSAGSVRCDLPGLAPGESAVVTVTARTAALGTFTNIINVTGSVSDIEPGNNAATNVVTIIPAADLVLSVVDRPDPVWLGENLVYTIAVTNLGPNPASTVFLNNSLPPGINYLSTSWSQGACTRSGDAVACNLGSLPVGSTATVTITARPNAPGLFSNNTQVTSDLADANPANNQANNTTRVIVNSGSFASTGTFAIPQLGPASIYPSTIFVTGLTASVFQVRVILTNLIHSYADDLDLLLVGPEGRSVLLMSDAGGDSPLNNVTLTLDAGAANALPDSGFIATGIFRTANYESVPDAFAAPAPPAPYGTNLNTFAGTDPNGTWSLYVVDDADKDSGALGGWRLTFSTLEPIADLLLAQTLSANPAAVSSNVVFTYSITNRGPANAINVRLTNALPSQLQGISFATSQGSCNLAGGTLICTLGNMPAGSFASVVVSGTALSTGTSPNLVSVTSDLLDLQPANNGASTVMVFENPPIITLHPVSQLVTNGDSVVLTGAAIGDPPLSYQWQRNGVNLAGATNAALIFNSVAPFNSGSYRLRVSNRVGVALSDEANLSVVGPPTISDIADRTIDEDTDTGLILFTVQDFESPPETLTVSGDSSDHAIVPPSAFVFNGTGSNRTVRVTPLPNTFGSVTIAISARDPDGGVSTNFFLLTITPINDLPAIADVSDQLSDEDVPLPVAFWVADSETAPETLLYVLTSSNPALVAGTNAVFSGDGTNRLATITPALHQYGNALLTISITDQSGAVASDTFSLTVVPVNDPPTLDPLDSLTLEEDSRPHTVNLTGITSGAPDEIQNLSVTAHSSHPAIIPNPAVSYSTSATTGSITFAPLPNASGPVTLTVTVKDGHPTNHTFSRSFVVDVLPANDAPTLANIPDQTTNEDTPLGIAIAIGDSDPPAVGGNAAALILTATSSQQDIVPDANLTITGTDANRSLTIHPLTNVVGTIVITVTVTDPQGSSTSDTFVLTVTPVNDAPTLDVISDRTVAEDAPAQFVVLTGISPGPANETQTLSFSATSSNPALIPDPTVQYSNANATAVLSFRPATNAVGTAILTVTADDGQPDNRATRRTFTVTIGATNDAPSLSTIANQTTDEDTPLAVAFTINDLETSPLNLVLSGASTNTSLVATTNILFSGSGTSRTVTLLPTTNQFGTSLITLRVTDGVLTNSESFLLTVNPVNDPPTLNPIAHFQTNSASGNPVYTVLLSGITDGPTNETQNLTFSAVSTNAALLPNPTVIYSNPDTAAAVALRPANNSGGVSLVTVTVNDGGSVNPTFSQSFLVFIKSSANTLPTISLIPAQTLAEDVTSPALPFTVRDAETPAAALTLLARSSNPQLLPDANIILTGTATNRTLTLTPALNHTGTAAVTLTAVDIAFGATNLTFNVTFTNVNDAPTLSTIADQTINEDISTGLINFTVNDVETRPGNLTVLASSANQTLVPNGNILLGGTGSDRGLIITPAPGQTGTSTITLRVTDGLATNTTTFLLTVNPTNQPPALGPIADLATDEDTPGTTAPFTISDRETAPGALTLTATSSNPALAPDANITFAGPADGVRTLTIVPSPHQTGTALITVQVTDAGGATAVRRTTFTVQPVNDAPTLDPIAAVLINENAGPQTIPLTGIGSGAINEIQVVALTAISTNTEHVANLSIDYTSPASTGTLNFLPVPNTNGIAHLTVTINDGQPANNLTTRTLTVTINAAPTLADIPNQITQEDTTTTPIPFTVADRDTPVEQLTVAGTTTNPTLVPDANILVQGTAANRTLTLTPAPNQFGTLQINLSVTDTNGASTTNHFFLTIEPVVDPITIVTPPRDFTAAVGATALFSVTANSVLPLTYQWQRNGTDIAGATDAELSLPNVQTSDAGDFSVLVSNADNSVFSPSAELAVVTVPPNPAIVSITQDGIVVNITFTSVAGLTYTLEYKESLSDPAWLPLGSTTGHGTVSLLSDPEPLPPTRFYRVRAD